MKIVVKLFIIILLFPIISLSVSAQTPTKKPISPKVDDDFPRLTIVSPEQGSQILGSKVTVTFVVNNFIFVDFAKRNKKTAGEGHMHVWLDEENPTPENAQKIIKATNFNLEDVPVGNHQLMLELVNNDHSSFNPPVIKIVSFATKQESAQPSITIGPTRPEAKGAEKGEIQMITTVGIFAITGLLFFILFAIILLKRKSF